MLSSSKILNPLTIREKLHLSKAQMSHLLNISANALSQWEQTNEPSNSEAEANLDKLQQIVSLTEKVYTPEGVEQLMFTPLNEFEGHTAYDIMSLGKYDRVIAFLAADYEGLGY